MTISLASYEPSDSKSLSRETRKSAIAAIAQGTIMSSFGSRTIPVRIGEIERDRVQATPDAVIDDFSDLALALQALSSPG